MDNFLNKLLDFSKSVVGLVVVIAAVLVFLDPLNLLNLRVFDLRVISSLLGMVILSFLIIFSQLKGNSFISHFLILWIFGSALSGFLGSLFSLSIGISFLMSLLRVAFLLYAILVLVANYLFDKPTKNLVDFKRVVPLGVLVLVTFILNGLGSAILTVIPLLVILYFGDNFKAYTYALYIALPIVINVLYYIFDDFKVLNNYLTLVGYGLVLFYLIKDYIPMTKSIN